MKWVLKGHSDSFPVQSVAFSPDSDTDRQMLASGGNDCDTRVSSGM